MKLQANADYLSGCRKPLAVLLPGLPFDEVEAKLKDATVALNRVSSD